MQITCAYDQIRSTKNLHSEISWGNSTIENSHRLQIIKSTPWNFFFSGTNICSKKLWTFYEANSMSHSVDNGLGLIWLVYWVYSLWMVLLVLTCYIHPADSTFRLLSRTWIIGYFEVHPLLTNRQKQKQNEEHHFSFSTSSFTCHSVNCGRFVQKSICPMAFPSDLSRFA